MRQWRGEDDGRRHQHSGLCASRGAAATRVLFPGERYWPLLAQALREADASGNLVFDAQIVAVCRENGVSALLTADRDFERFTDCRTERL